MVLRTCASYKIFYCFAEYHTYYDALIIKQVQQWSVDNCCWHRSGRLTGQLAPNSGTPTLFQQFADIAAPCPQYSITGIDSEASNNSISLCKSSWTSFRYTISVSISINKTLSINRINLPCILKDENWQAGHVMWINSQFIYVSRVRLNIWIP